jgi:hypothetical protein
LNLLSRMLMREGASCSVERKTYCMHHRSKHGYCDAGNRSTSGSRVLPEIVESRVTGVDPTDTVVGASSSSSSGSSTRLDSKASTLASSMSSDSKIAGCSVTGSPILPRNFHFGLELFSQVSDAGNLAEARKSGKISQRDWWRRDTERTSVEMEELVQKHTESLERALGRKKTYLLKDTAQKVRYVPARELSTWYKTLSPQLLGDCVLEDGLEWTVPSDKELRRLRQEVKTGEWEHDLEFTVPNAWYDLEIKAPPHRDRHKVTDWETSWAEFTRVDIKKYFPDGVDPLHSVNAVRVKEILLTQLFVKRVPKDHDVMFAKGFLEVCGAAHADGSINDRAVGVETNHFGARSLYLNKPAKNPLLKLLPDKKKAKDDTGKKDDTAKKDDTGKKKRPADDNDISDGEVLDPSDDERGGVAIGVAPPVSKGDASSAGSGASNASDNDTTTGDPSTSADGNFVSVFSQDSRDANSTGKDGKKVNSKKSVVLSDATASVLKLVKQPMGEVLKMKGKLTSGEEEALRGLLKSCPGYGWPAKPIIYLVFGLVSGRLKVGESIEGWVRMYQNWHGEEAVEGSVGWGSVCVFFQLGFIFFSEEDIVNLMTYRFAY